MLSEPDRASLLSIARAAITAAAADVPLPLLDLNEVPHALPELRATFVTLNEYSQLRGCIGGLYANRPLALDVQGHARDAALHDPRFMPVTSDEVPHLHIEISVLTEPELISHTSPEDLLAKLRPESDGLILVNGYHRATFLPQVWERMPDKVRFLEMLSEKMGDSPNAWRQPGTEVYRYQVEEFEEPK